MSNNFINIRKEELDKFSYINNNSTGGSQFERDNWRYLVNIFPNLEIFWKYFVVPMTNRIKAEIPDNNLGKLDYRNEVNKKIKKIGIIPHLIFYQLKLARDHLSFPHYYSFQYFYIHLNTVCDLMYDFIIRINTLLKNNDEVIKKDDQVFIDFKNYEDLIGKYRNKIVHESNIHPMWFKDKVFVPKNDKIKKYLLKIYSSSELGKLNQVDIDNDFIEVSIITNNDFNKLCDNLNQIFNQIIKKMEILLFEEKNLELLTMYKIKIV